MRSFNVEEAIKKTGMVDDFLSTPDGFSEISGGDIDSIKKTGIYWINNAVNIPVGSSQYGHLIVTSVDENYVIQQWTDANSPFKTWKRAFGGTIWYDWKLIIDSEGGAINGSLGIGTDTLTNQLNVQSDDNHAVARIESTDEGKSAQLRLYSSNPTASGRSSILHKNGQDTNFWDTGVDTDGLYKIAYNENGNMATGLRMSIDKAGTTTYYKGQQFSIDGGIRRNNDVLHYYDVTTQTGTLKITLPKGFQYTKLQGKILGGCFGNSNDKWTIEFAFVTGVENGGTFHYPTANIRGFTPINKFRLAYDGEKCCILIGDTSSTWGRLEVVLTDIITSLSGIDGYNTGWSLEVISDESSLTKVTEVTLDRLGEVRELQYEKISGVDGISNVVNEGVGHTIYYADPTCTDLPTGVIDGAVETFVFSNAWAYQNFYDWRTGIKYTRKLTNTVWSFWRADATERTAPIRVDLTNQIKNDAYRKSVIALCDLDNAFIGSSSYSSGNLIFKRANGLQGMINIRFDIEKKYDSEAIFVNYEVKGMSYAEIEPCTFTYNGKKYGGFSVYITPPQLGTVNFLGITDFDNIFGVDYYDTQTNTPLNEEINNSLSFSDVHLTDIWTYNGRSYTKPNKNLITTGFVNGWSGSINLRKTGDGMVNFVINASKSTDIVSGSEVVCTLPNEYITSDVVCQTVAIKKGDGTAPDNSIGYVILETDGSIYLQPTAGSVLTDYRKIDYISFTYFTDN